MTYVRRFGPVVAATACIALALVIVEPSILTSTIRSPRALAVIVVIAVATSVAGRIVRRRWGRGAGRLTGLAALGLCGWLLVAPALRQTTLNESLPGVPTAATAGSPESSEVSTPPPGTVAITSPSNAMNGSTTTTGGTTSTTTVVPAPPNTPAGAEDSGVVTSPSRVTTGRLAGIGHEASGEVSVYRLADGTAIVRFEEVDIRGAPDPVLYLVPGIDRRSRDGGVKVGPLKATKGSFNHTVPASFDLDQPLTVFVWCDRFATPIASADQRRL